MSDITVFLEQDGNIINIHFPGEVEFSDMSHPVLDDLLNKGVEILAFSDKFNNSNQKSEIMPSGESKVERDPTQFEVIASRLDACRGRILVSTNLLHLCVDNLNGSEPEDTDEKGKIQDSAGGSILSGLDRLMRELENQVSELEAQQNRLSRLLNIHL